jgi:hypothetical protein
MFFSLLFDKSFTDFTWALTQSYTPTTKKTFHTETTAQEQHIMQNKMIEFIDTFIELSRTGEN